MDYKVFFVWLSLVIIWNFGYPTALPILDVLVAAILSFISKYIEIKIGVKNDTTI
jgi:hypothetical protein